MSLLYQKTGNDRAYLFRPKVQDTSLRFMTHGPVRSMEEKGLWARLFGWGR